MGHYGEGGCWRMRWAAEQSTSTEDKGCFSRRDARIRLNLLGWLVWPHGTCSHDSTVLRLSYIGNFEEQNHENILVTVLVTTTLH